MSSPGLPAIVTRPGFVGCVRELGPARFRLPELAHPVRNEDAIKALGLLYVTLDLAGLAERSA